MSNEMHPDLKWLAENVSEWPEGLNGKVFNEGGMLWNHTAYGSYKHIKYIDGFTKPQWLQARRDLGLVMTEAEEEMVVEEREPKKSKYHREIKPGVWVDVYDVLHAWRVQNPALQHLIKKALQPGERGHKTREQDMKDIIASALRAGELGE